MAVLDRGFTEFSMAPGVLPRAGRVIHDISAGEMGQVAARVFTPGTIDDIKQVLVDGFVYRDVGTGVNAP